MTLRLRLIIGLLALLMVGLALFGTATYTLDRRSEYQRLDSQLRTTAPAAGGELEQVAGVGDGRDGGGLQFGNGPGAFGGPGGPGGGGPPIQVVPYAELLSTTGQVLAHIQPQASTSAPELPANLPAPNHPFTVGSTSGSGSFRAVVSKRDGYTTVVALPTTDVDRALHGLILIETGAALALLVALSVGAWFVLRRGLRPLELMAGTAGSITGGDLSKRVSPSGGPTEVGQLGLALNTMLDDIEEAFKEREATEMRLRQFLADASHELRTPLTSIQGFAELFRVSGGNAAVDLPTILRRIEQESARMKVLVEDLLLLARLDQPRVAERQPVDLAVLAADACSDAVATAPDHPVTLDAPLPVVISGDQAHLRQAVANLVTNAVRHTPPGTRIEVGAAMVDGSARVTVRDNGPGLDEDAKAHVFDRFWQADKARVGAGAGLGLAIVAGIAAEHGGVATADNSPGGGALFTLTLPLTRPQ